MMNYADEPDWDDDGEFVPPKKMRRFFPWALFLGAAAILALLAFMTRHAHAEPDVYACYGAARYQAMAQAWPGCDEVCGRVKAYLQLHTEAEARAKAVEMHLPKWMVRKAEACR